MTIYFSGKGLGLFHSTLNQLNQSIGQQNRGKLTDQTYINVLKGSLLIQRRDVLLVGQGHDAQVLRTYDSQGNQQDDNGDNWSMTGLYLNGAYTTAPYNTQHHTFHLRHADGAIQSFTFDSDTNRYVSTEGAGADDYILVHDAYIERVDGDSGHVARFSKETGKHLQSVDADGVITRYEYDYNGYYITQITTSNNEVIHIEYDDNAEAPSKITKSVYSDDSRTTLITESVVTYAYDGYRLSAVNVDLTPEDQSDTLFYRTEYVWDDNQNVIRSLKNSDGTQLSFTYDYADRIKTLTDGENNVTEFSYDTYDEGVEVTRVKSPQGVMTEYQHSSTGDLIKMLVGPVNGQYEVTAFTYYADKKLESVTDATGSVTHYAYDDNGNRIQETFSNGNSITRLYSSDNLLLNETQYLKESSTEDPLTTRYVYDAERHLRFIINGDGDVIENQYSAVGNLQSTRTYLDTPYPLQRVEASDVLTLSQLESWASQQDLSKIQLEEYRYDFRGQLSETRSFSETDEAGNGIGPVSQKTFIYDARGRLLKTISPTGNSTSAVNDGVTTYAYDGMDRLLAETTVDGRTRHMIYDDANHQIITSDEKGLQTTEIFDRAGRLVSFTEVDASNNETRLGRKTYAYHADGQLAAITDDYGARSYRFYDDAGRLFAEVDATGAVTEYTRDAVGRITLTYHYADRVSTQNWYDANQNRVLIADYATVRPNKNATYDRAYETYYDDLGRLSYEYDAEGRAKEYTFDGANRLIRSTVSADDGSGLNRVERYFYDAAGRLIGQLDAEGYLVTKEYDSAGNLIEMKQWANAVDADLRAEGSLLVLKASAGYAADNRIETSLYNARGQKIAMRDGENYVTHFHYDLEGRLINETRFANPIPEEEAIFSGETQQLAEFGTNVGGWSSYDTYPRTLGDVNGDGLADVVGFASNGVHVALANGQGFDASTIWVEQYGTERGGWVSFDQYPRMLADVNGDGRDDIVGFGHNATYVSLSNGTGFDAHQVWSTEFDFSSEGTFYQTTRWVGDVDGDGKDDILAYKNNALWIMQTNADNTGFAAPRQWADADNTFDHSLDIYDDEPSVLGDVNGDGKFDFVHFGYDAVYVRLSTGEGFSEYVNWGAADFAALDTDGFANYQKDEPRLVGDINGDGLMDAVAFLKDGVYVAYSEGNAFAKPEKIIEGFTVEAGGWRDFNTYPRVVADFTGNGQADIIGFASTGVYTASLQEVRRYSWDINDWQPNASENDQVATYTYDIAGRLIRSIDAQGMVSTFAYDAAGRLVHEIQGAAPQAGDYADQTYYQYDAKNRVIGRVEGKAATWLSGSHHPAETAYYAGQFGELSTFDAAGRLIKTQYEGNKSTLYYYDDEGRVAYVVNNEGGVTANVYNAFGEMSQKIHYGQRLDTQGLTGGNLSTAPDFVERVKGIQALEQDSYTAYQYNRRGQVTQVLQGQKAVIEGGTIGTHFSTINSTYNGLGDLHRQETDFGTGNQRWQSKVHHYDQRGLLTRVETSASDASDQVRGSTYNAFGELTDSWHQSVVRNTTITYDRRGLVTTQTDPFNATRATTYDAFGRQITTTDGRGHITRYEYRDAENTTITTLPEGQQLVTRFNQHGQTLTMTDAEGNVTEYRYDAHGKEQEIVFNGITQRRFDRDDWGFIRDEYDGENRGTRYEYDAMGRIFKRIQDPAGLALTTAYYYDAKGQMITQMDPDGLSTHFEYDLAGRQITLIRENGHGTEITAFDYDSDGRVIEKIEALTNEEQRTTHYAYDGHGNLIKEILDPHGLQITTQYQYDQYQQRTVRIDAEGYRTYYAYDALGRVLYHVDGNGAVQETLYDKAGNLIATIDYAQVIDTSRLTKELLSSHVLSELSNQVSDYQANRVTFSLYDANNRETYRLNVLDSQTIFVTESRWDKANRLVESIRYSTPITLSNVNNAVRSLTLREQIDVESLITVNAQDDRRTRYVYDDLGQVKYTIQSLHTGFSDAVVQQNDYDRAGNLITQTHYASLIGYPSSTPSVEDFEQTLASRWNFMDNPDNRVTHFIYDNANRERFVVRDNGSVNEKRYNDRGFVEEERQYADLLPSHVQLTTSDITLALSQSDFRHTGYEYDGQGRVIAKINAYGDKELYEYNRLGLKTAFIDRNGNRYEFEYDAAGRLEKEISPKVSVYQVESLSERHLEERHIVTYYQYDAKGNVVRVYHDYEGSEQRMTSFEYDAENRKTHVYRQAAGTIGDKGEIIPGAPGENVLQTVTHYNAFGDVTAVADANTLYEYTLYDNLGRVKIHIDRSNYVTEYHYNAFSNVTETIRYEGQANLYKLEPDGWQRHQAPSFEQMKIAFTPRDDWNNRVLQQRYDSLGRLTSTSQDTITAYHARSDLTQAINPQQVFEYNAFNEMTMSLLAMGYGEGNDADRIEWAYTHYYYDDLGRQYAMIDPEGYLTFREFTVYDQVQFEYEASNRVNQTINPFATDKTALSQHQQDGDYSRKLEYKYDELGRISLEIIHNVRLTAQDDRSNAVSRSTLYRYDKVGNQTMIIDNLGNATTRKFDTLNRLIQTVGPDRDVWSRYLEADPDDLTITDNLRTYYYYNAHGDLTSTAENSNLTDLKEQIFQYDKQGRRVLTITTFKDAFGENYFHLLRHDYNNRDQITEQTLYQFKNVESTSGLIRPKAQADFHEIYEYDPRGHRSSHSVKVNETLTKRSHVSYNAFGEVFWRYETYNGDSKKFNEAFYRYDKAGNLIELTRGNIASGQAYITTYDYNAAGFLTRESVINLATSGNRSVLNTKRFDYDLLGHQIWEKKSDITNIYKNGNRETFSPSLSYTYDRWGNVTQQHNELGHITAWVYDQDNRVLEQSEKNLAVYDLQSDAYQLKNTQQTYGYDSLGRLVSYTDANGNETRHTYDSIGNVMKTHVVGEDIAYFVHDSYGRQLAKFYSPVEWDILFQQANKTVTDEIILESVLSTALDYTRYNTLGQAIEVGFKKPNLQADTLSTTVVHRYVYDAMGNRTFTIDGKAFSSHNYSASLYDGLGQLQSHASANGDQKVYNTFYENGQLIQDETDQAGNRIRTLYDSYGRKSEVFYYRADDPTEAFQRIEYGYLRSQDVLQTEFIYDNKNQSLASKFYTYTEDHLLRQVVLQLKEALDEASGAEFHANNTVTNYFYDSAGRVKQQDHYLMYDLYDSFSSQDPTQSTEFHYDALGRLIRSQQRVGQNTLSVNDVNIYHDAQGNIIKNTLLSYSPENPNGITEDYYHAYDAANRLRVSNGSRVFDSANNRYLVALNAQRYTLGDEENSSSDVTDVTRSGKGAEITYNAKGQKTKVTTFVGRVVNPLVAGVGYHYDEYRTEYFQYNDYGWLETIRVGYEAKNISLEPGLTHIIGRDSQTTYQPVVVEQRDYYLDAAAQAGGYFGKIKVVTRMSDGYRVDGNKMEFHEDDVGMGWTRTRYAYNHYGLLTEQKEYRWAKGRRLTSDNQDTTELFNDNPNLSGNGGRGQAHYEGAFFNSQIRSDYVYKAGTHNVLQSYEVIEQSEAENSTTRRDRDYQYAFTYDWKGEYLETSSRISDEVGSATGQVTDRVFYSFYNAMNDLVLSDSQVGESGKRTYLRNLAADGSIVSRDVLSHAVYSDAGVGRRPVFATSVLTQEANKGYVSLQGQLLASVDSYGNALLSDTYGLNADVGTAPRQRIMVSGNDTLDSLARAYYGDASLWYLIADANGLGFGAELKEGMTLTLPDVSASLKNTSETFAPYNPTADVGVTLPSPVPVDNDTACRKAGAIGLVVAAIVAAVIIMVATKGAGIKQASLLVKTAAATAGAVAGSAARQQYLTNVGLQNGIDWKDVAIEGVIAGATAGAAHGINQIAPVWAATAAKAGASYAIRHGVNKVAGRETAWDNRDLLAQLGAGLLVGGPNESWGDIVGASVNNVAQTAVAALIRTGLDTDQSRRFSERFNERFDWAEAAGSEVLQYFGQVVGTEIGSHIAATSVGQSIGNGIVQGLSRPTPQRLPEAAYLQANTGGAFLENPYADNDGFSLLPLGDNGAPFDINDPFELNGLFGQLDPASVEYAYAASESLRMGIHQGYGQGAIDFTAPVNQGGFFSGLGDVLYDFGSSALNVITDTASTIYNNPSVLLDYAGQWLYGIGESVNSAVYEGSFGLLGSREGYLATTAEALQDFDNVLLAGQQYYDSVGHAYTFGDDYALGRLTGVPLVAGGAAALYGASKLPFPKLHWDAAFSGAARPNFALQGGSLNIGEILGSSGRGEFSRLVPGGGLQTHEGVLSVFNQPTHTIQRHVGQSFSSLESRLANNNRLRQVSTFNNRSQAEYVLSKAIDLRTGEIDQFLSQPFSSVARNNRLVLNVPLNENTGNILIRGNNQFIEGSGVKLIIDRVQNQTGLPYTIVTGFPTK